MRVLNVEEGLPFDNGEVDVCYASHVLEHLSQGCARALLLEGARVLRRGGVIRLAVPDLEAVVREYLHVLAQAESGDLAALKQYEWITLELLDQLVRVESGGEMGRYLQSRGHHNAEYVKSRIGSEAEAYFKLEPKEGGRIAEQAAGLSQSRYLLAVSSTFISLKRIFQGQSRWREQVTAWLCGQLLGRRGRLAIQEGLFRTSGECHRWMYDHFSLKQLLEQCGFTAVRRCTAFESRIERFASFNLDVVNGKVRKPDSLFMEAVKPY
ncbi:MAG TPA: methyltransferase domain-containing protein [Nitrospira sp.]